MRWRLGSDRFRVQLSMETEPVEDRPAAPGRARRSGQAAELRLTDAPPIGHQLRVVYDPEDTSHVQLDDPGVPIVRLLILAAAVASTIGVALRYAVGRRAPFAVQAAVFLVIWLGGVLFWEPVVS